MNNTSSNDEKTILFVDDEESILDIASEYFRQMEFNVLTAQNAFKAMEILQHERIDCCFTDINMPGMDGIELAEYIWENDKTIPVIIMTGYPSMEKVIHTMKSGVVDFLIKPVNLNQMKLCVQRVLRERELFIENLMLKKELEGKERLERLNVQLYEKVQELDICNKITSDFISIKSSSDVFKRLVEICQDITNCDESRFFIVSEDVSRVFEIEGAFLASSGGNSGKGEKGKSVYLESGRCFDGRLEKIIQETVFEKAPMLVPENKGAYDIPEDIHSFLAVPLSIRDRPFGVLTASIKTGENHFSSKELYYLVFMTQKAAYAIENLALYENIYDNLFATLDSFVNAIEARDPYTEQHSNRVTEIALGIGEELGCSQEEIDILNFAGRLHDIGKIGIRDNILLKKGELTSEEYEEIKKHPIIGAEIVGKLGLWEKEQEIIRHHHEKFDGTGYPDGLKGKEIPRLARILTVADVYDAMASDRIYRVRMPQYEILKRIEKGAGSHFDPEIVDVFFKLQKEGKIFTPDEV